MVRGEIPIGLGAAFGVAAARRAGVTPSRLRARDLDRPFRGARTIPGAQLISDEIEDAARTYPRTAEVRRVHERAAQYAPVMPTAGFFCGITAAALWDTPLPGGILASGSGADEESAHSTNDPDILDVGVLWPHRALRGSGVRGHAIRPELVSTVTHPRSGLRLTSPASTWAMLGGQLPHLYDLIAIGDHLVRMQRPPYSRPWENVPPPLATIAQLIAAAGAGRRTGVAALREAVPSVRTGSASRMETWTRLTLVDAGLPEPVLDHDILDRNGRFLARVDMAYPQWKIAIEYDGRHHGEGEQWERDVDRLARLEAEGWLVIRVTRTLLFAHPETVAARVRAAIARRAH